MRRYAQQEEDLRKQLGLPFEHEEKLGAATRRQQEIVEALDITKNQASAKVDEGMEHGAGERPQQAENISKKSSFTTLSVPL